MRLAVTGGAGFIGSYLAKEITEQGHTPIIIDSLVRGRLENLERSEEHTSELQSH